MPPARTDPPARELRGTLAFILSAVSGSGRAEAASERIEELLHEAGQPAQVEIVGRGSDLRDAVEGAKARNARAIVIGGGDGSVSVGAAALAGSNTPLGVVPLGTLNHFARDMGIPLDIDAAVGVVLAGNTKRIDVGEVNGRAFVNNSSVGLYSRMVQIRERYRKLGSRKWFAAAKATFQVLDRAPAMAVRIVVAGDPLVYRTSIVMVANNEYLMEGLDAASRDSLTDGHLAIYVVKSRGMWQLLRLVGSVFLGNSRDPNLLEIFRTTSVTIESRHSRMMVALDGEIETMETPLEYRVRPAALSVLVAPGAPA